MSSNLQEGPFIEKLAYSAALGLLRVNPEQAKAFKPGSQKVDLGVKFKREEKGRCTEKR
jgi:hypothetical protein